MKSIFSIAIVCFCAVMSGAAQAQSAKPADVLVVVETVGYQIERLYEATLKKVPATAALNLTPRRPRHVYSKAREVFTKTQMLRQLNGLPENSLPPLPAGEITPGDVRALVMLVSRDVTSVLPAYWAQASDAVPKKRVSATPTDVYQGLHKLSQQLDGLGLPAVVPNDVHRIARMISAGLADVYRARSGKAFANLSRGNAQGKSPVDAYNEGYAFLVALKAFTETTEGADLPGGIVLPNRPSGRITPTAVMELANTIYADLGSLKVVSGASMDGGLAKPSAGMTPSNVYDEFLLAQNVLAAL